MDSRTLVWRRLGASLVAVEGGRDAAGAAGTTKLPSSPPFFTANEGSASCGLGGRWSGTESVPDGAICLAGMRPPPPPPDGRAAAGGR